MSPQDYFRPLFAANKALAESSDRICAPVSQAHLMQDVDSWERCESMHASNHLLFLFIKPLLQRVGTSL